MKKILFIALAAVGLTACVQDQNVAVPQCDTIAFGNAYLDNAVRAAVDPSTTTSSISDFKVWGFMDSNVGTVFTAEEVKKVNGSWGYANTQYWAPEHDYYFSALSPIDGDWSVSNADATVDGLSNVSFTNNEGAIDLLYAAATAETPNFSELTTKGMQPVTMPFQHILSKVKFTFKNGFTTDNADVVVSNIQMTAPKSGTINLVGAFDSYKTGWVLGSEATTLAFGDVVRLDMGVADECATERFTIPAADYTYNVTFHVTVYTGAEVALEVDKTATISGYALEMGKAYNFTAEINPDNLGLAPIEFSATVEDWDTTPADVPVGYYIGANGEYVVSTTAGLEQIVEDINNGNDTDRTVVLDGDLDLSASRSLVSNWTPLGNENQVFEGTFDGNGHTIKNLVLVANEPGYFYGFFGCAENATIKNVNFENITVNIPSDNTNEGGHIAGIAGYAQNVTFEDITVSGDVKVESTFDANASSRVAVVAGGNYGGTVTMKNVHINVNAGSYVKANNCVGGLAGQLQGKTVFENCSSNIDVYGYKFFAGGIIGLTANDSKFTNCHTSGNVSIEHGRANNINDLYRVGAIAGGWDESFNLPLVLENCSYTGTISGKDADGNVANPLDCAGYVGRGYGAKAGTVVEVNGVSYKYAGNGVFYTVGAIVEVEGVKAVVYSVSADSVKAVSVEELNLNGKTWQGAMDWAAGLGEGWALASMEDLNAIYDLRVALNKALVADNAENALFWEGDELYIKNGSVYYANYMSSTEVPNGADANGNKYFSNRVFFKQFNDKGYSDVLYSAFDCINKYAPLKDNYFARATVTL